MSDQHARSSLRLGAADVAPTAPHATEPADRRYVGPARFWSAPRARAVFNAALLSSIAFHVIVTPFRVLPDSAALKLSDHEGELTIPVELLGEDPPPPPPPPAAVEEPGPSVLPPPRIKPPVPKLSRDAGVLPDAEADGEAPDAEVLAVGAERLGSDGGAADAAPSDAATFEGGALLAGGPRDPGSMIGTSNLVTAGPTNVTLLVNVAVLRQNPIAARLGPLVFEIPQWKAFLQDARGTVDPIQDTDWILIYGPSLMNTSRDAVLVHYSVSDDVVDRAVEAASKRYENGGAFDAGVPGVKASLAHADGAERVLMRVQPHVLTMVPKDKAAEFAKVLKRAAIAPRVRPKEALRLVMRDPSTQIKIRGVKFDKAVTELRLSIVPRADGGADVHLEGDCVDEPTAVVVAETLTDHIRQQNTILVKALTRGLLNTTRVTAEGPMIRADIAATKEQLEALLQALAAAVGGNAPPP